MRISGGDRYFTDKLIITKENNKLQVGHFLVKMTGIHFEGKAPFKL